MNSKWVVNVPVATLWTSYNSPREMDEKAISNPALVEGWVKGLSHSELLELCDANLVQSQALYGEEVLVIDEKNDWVQVILVDQPSSKDERGYPGWLPKKQIKRVEEWNVKTGPIAIVTADKAQLYGEDEKPFLEMSFQTILPFLSKEKDLVKVQTPTGIGYIQEKDVDIAPSFLERKKGSGKDIVAAGERFLDLPYLWGGMSSYGYDCSGFSYNMCKANGYLIPRDAGDQSKAGKSIKLTDIEPGDLLFFAYEEGKGALHHVGIYYGDGKMLHSPNTGKTVEIIELKGTIYEKELCAASRYW